MQSRPYFTLLNESIFISSYPHIPYNIALTKIITKRSHIMIPQTNNPPSLLHILLRLFCLSFLVSFGIVWQLVEYPTCCFEDVANDKPTMRNAIMGSPRMVVGEKFNETIPNRSPKNLKCLTDMDDPFYMEIPSNTSSTSIVVLSLENDHGPNCWGEHDFWQLGLPWIAWLSLAWSGFFVGAFCHGSRTVASQRTMETWVVCLWVVFCFYVWSSIVLIEFPVG